MNNKAPMVRLGDYIEECDKRNSDNSLTLENVRGISIDKKFILTKANMDGVSLCPYKVVEPGWFCYVTVTSRNGEKISLAHYKEMKPAIVSSSYVVFRSKDEDILLPEYLFMLFNRSEFDRYSRFNSWGSARETLDFSELCRTKIPLPSIDTQRELVAIYDGLKKIVTENEILIKPLEEACRSFIVNCEQKYPKSNLGKYIEECDKRNKDCSFDERDIVGINLSKSFFPTVANLQSTDLTKYKIVPPGHFACNLMHIGRDVRIPIAFNYKSTPEIVSPAYYIFHVKESMKDVIHPLYLMLLFERYEFDRFCWFSTDSSVRGNLPTNVFKNIEIPVPPIEIQRSIAAVSHCLETAKRIIQETRERMKNLCPALVQKAVHSA